MLLCLDISSAILVSRRTTRNFTPPQVRVHEKGRPANRAAFSLAALGSAAQFETAMCAQAGVVKAWSNSYFVTLSLTM